MKFWEWYRRLTKAESFSKLTVEVFGEIQQADFLSEMLETTKENAERIWKLMCTVRYQKEPKITRYRLTLRMMRIMTLSKEFSISLEEAEEKLRRAKARRGNVSGEMT